MAKSTKYTAKVPKLEDYKPDWLNEDGEIEDADKVLKVVHTLMSDKAKAQDAREDALVEIAERTTERDELQAKVDDKNAPDAQLEIQKANDRATKAEADAKVATARADRIEVALDKGLTPAQAKRLQGETKEELEADADELLEAWGAAKADEGKDGEEDDENLGRQTPRNVVNSSDPKLGKTGDEGFDFEKWADEQSAGRF